MNRTTPRHARHSAIRRIAAIPLAVGLLALVGCGGDDGKNPVSPGGGTPSTTTFTGFASDGIVSGKLSITVNTTSLTGGLRSGALHAATVVATGSVQTPTSTTPLTGTYDPDLDSLRLAGTGWSLVGELLSDGNDTTLLGQAAGPNGPGFFLTGHFTSSAPRIYTGKYFSATTSDSGTWDMAAQVDTLFIVAYRKGDPEPVFLNGMVAGSPPDRSISASGGSPSTFDLYAGGTLNTITGAASGTWSYTYIDIAYYPDDFGTWSGTLIP